MSKIELKSKQFARRYIANNMNGTKTAKELYNPKNDNVANAIASENLQKPIFRRAIEEAMEKAGITDEVLAAEHEKVIKQSKHLPSKNTAIDMAYKLKGAYAPERKETKTLNINLDNPEEIKNAIKEVISELKQLDEQ